MTPEIHTLNGLHFIVEESIINARTYDIIFWEAAGSIQHAYIASTNEPLPRALEYAYSLAQNLAQTIHDDIHRQRMNAYSVQLELLP